LVKEKLLIELHFLPCIEFFCLLSQFEQIEIESSEHFVKQSYRNRAYIRTANKVVPLTIPVKKGNRKIPVQNIEIDYNQRWLKDHWKSITSAYGKAPFYEHFVDYFREIFYKNHKFLFDFNWDLLSLCLHLLKLKRKITFSANFCDKVTSATYDARGLINPKIHFTKNNFYRPIPYYQVFGAKFDANLSILDLLFCEGSNALNIIQESVNEHTNKRIIKYV